MQFFTQSPDGTQVPYFVVRQKDTVMDGTNPTLLYGYGGFRIALNPSYSPIGMLQALRLNGREYMMILFLWRKI